MLLLLSSSVLVKYRLPSYYSRLLQLRSTLTLSPRLASACAMSTRQVYTGGLRRLVLAFDLGTTYSGVSFAILDPGKVPKIETVSRYPGQEAGDAKIPTVIYYDKDGKAVAIGAEEPPVSECEGEDDWEDEPAKLEWFKLLLRPSDHSVTLTSDIPTPKLPPNKTIIDVYADFYRYLFHCARTFIQQTKAALGTLIWESMENDIEVVLTHPNGWAGPQQHAMRRAAVQAGLVPDSPEGRSRVTFVSEGEASLHYCVSSGLVSEAVEAEKRVTVIDAGGGTVDISSYAFTSMKPVVIEEIAIPSCLVEGSVIVRRRAETTIRNKLQSSAKFNSERYVQAIVQEFDNVAKKRFKGTSDANVRFSSLVSDRDPAVGIRNGMLKLSKDELCALFDPAVNAIADASKKHCIVSAHTNIRTVFLVGGFAASEYLFEQLASRFRAEGMVLCRPDSHTNKAVAEGAVSFHIDHFVSARVAPWTYGAHTITQYNSSLASHARRSHKTFKDVTGKTMLRQSFCPVMAKGEQAAETREFRKKLYYQRAQSLNNTAVSLTILAYRGDSAVPDFIDEDEGSFATLCTVSGTLTKVPSVPFYPPEAQAQRHSANSTVSVGVGKKKGKQQKPKPTYYTQEVDVVLSFGLTELKAQLAWMRKGVEQRSPAQVIYEDDFAVTVAG